MLDLGTLDHVFDVKAAVFNIVDVLKVGGVVIIYDAMIGWHNQTLYNFQPPFFFDTFSVNGFSEIQLFIHYYPKYGHGRKTRTKWREFHYNDEISFRKPFHYTACFFIARKMKHVKINSFFQGYYLGHHTKHLAQGETLTASIQPTFLEGTHIIVKRLYPFLAHIFRYLPNFIRVIFG